MVGWGLKDFVLVLVVPRHLGSAAEMARVEPVSVELSGSRRVEEWLVVLVHQ